VIRIIADSIADLLYGSVTQETTGVTLHITTPVATGRSTVPAEAFSDPEQVTVVHGLILSR